MARDLIPPPSPAGRPTSPGGPPTLIELPPEPPRSGAEPSLLARPEPSRFRNRFGFLIGALAGVVVAVAITVAIVLVTGDTAAQEGFAPHWSAWQPSQSDVSEGAQEIADHVAPEYKQDNGSQLGMVQSLPLGSIPIVVRPAQGKIVTIAPSHGVFFAINDLGANGAMTRAPSAQRLRLLRREALELALYTFRYIKDVDTVMAVLPAIPKGAATPGGPTTEAVQQAVFYRPGDLKQQLQVPLRLTLTPKTPLPHTIGRRDGRTVDALTLANVFKLSAPPGQPYLVLDRAGAG